MRVSALNMAVIFSLSVGCSGEPGRHVPHSKNLQGHDEVRRLQANLDKTLQEHSPFVFELLASPATDAEIAKLRAALNSQTHPHLELWYQWHNGCNDHPVRLLPLGSLLSVDEAIEDRSFSQNEPFVHERRKRNIKLLDDGAGDGFFLDLEASPPRVYYEMLEDPSPTDFGTMSQFLQFITRVHAAGITSVNEHGGVEFDDAIYQNLEDEHLNSITNDG